MTMEPDDAVQQMQESFSETMLAEKTQQEVLTFLLSFAVKKKGAAAEKAQILLQHFGSISEVLDAKVPTLMKVGGLTENAAVLLSMIPQVCARMEMEASQRTVVRGREAVRDFASKCFIGQTVERILLICLDKKGKMIDYRFLSEGAVDWANVDVRKLVSVLLEKKAAAFVVAHNHPRGQAHPSDADELATRLIANATVPLGFEFQDHLIFSVCDYYSMAEHPKECGECLKPDA